MKISVIIAAMVVGIVGAARGPRAFVSEFRDFPQFFEGKTRIGYSRPPHSRLESYFGHGIEEVDLFSDNLPSPPYRENRLYFGPTPPSDSSIASSYFPDRRPLHSSTFFRDGPASFRESFHHTAQDYKGPPPPMFRDEPRQLAYSPLISSVGDSLDLQATKAIKGMTFSQQTTAMTRQPLSFAGHSSHLSFVSGLTSSDINPLSEVSSTARPTSPMPGQPLQQQDTLTSSTETSTSAVTLEPKIAGTESLSTADVRESTTSRSALVTPKPSSESATSPPPVNAFHGDLRPFYDPSSKVITQELPAATHGQLPIESLKQHQLQSEMKENFLVYESKGGSSFGHSDHQYYHQSSINNNGAPLRFNIPATTNPISMKIEFQGLDIHTSPPSLASVPQANNYIQSPNHIESAHLPKLNLPLNSVSNVPTYFILQPNEQPKQSSQPNSNIHFGSFFVYPNDDQMKQSTQSNLGGHSGAQLQISDFRGIEFLSSPGNAQPMRPTSLDFGQVSFGVPEHYRASEPMYT